MPGHCCFEGDFADRIFADGFLQTAFLQMGFCRWILQMAFSAIFPCLFLCH
jgi:hypothetical protein